jgi:hypothetical protein
MGTMCTVVIDFDPADPHPVLLAGIRDEFGDRPWIGPGRHWPEHPGLVGGRDLLAGGTWLAAAPDLPRVACILNGRGALAPAAGRLSRGELPLRFAETGSLAGVDYDRYDPFHLVCAGVDDVRIASWNGAEATEQVLPTGLHLIVNSGLEGRDPTEGPGTQEMNARLAHFRPRLRAAPRPVPSDGQSTAQAWGAWLPLIDGDGMTVDDERALVLRREFGDGRTWGTTSVTLVALRRAGGLRYDFNATPGAAEGWRGVEVG